MRAQASDDATDAMKACFADLAAAPPGQAIPVDGLPPLRELLDRVPRSIPTAYFESRCGQRETLGIGAVDLLRADASRIEDLVHRVPRTGTWLGCMRFDPEAEPSDAWRPFGAAWFLRPTLLFDRSGATTRARKGGTLPPELAEALSESTPLPTSAAARGFAPDPDSGWSRAMQRTHEAIEQGQVEKVVLARAALATCSEALAVGRLLEESTARAPQSYRFSIRPDAQHVFFGASPELLLRSTGDTVATEALAGTRSQDRAEDLLRTDKELREQDYVSRAVRDALVDIGAEQIEERGPTPRAHGRLAHLATVFEAKLDVARVPQLLAALHPTPAVCGTPRDAALELVRAHEGIDRGVYAGLVGVVREGDVEFCVALRSVLLADSLARVFAGSGVVAGSRFEDEDREIEAKSRLWREILGA